MEKYEIKDNHGEHNDWIDRNAIKLIFVLIAFIAFDSIAIKCFLESIGAW